MAERKKRTPKSSAELKAQLEAAKKKVADLEKRAYAEELAELIASTSIANDFKRIQDKVGDIKPLAILAAIAEVVGIKRLELTQAPAPKRKPADPNKPRKPRGKKSESA